MNWNTLNDLNQLDDWSLRSYEKPIVVFKHSKRCSISSMVLGRLEREHVPPNVDFYFLDIFANREISNVLAERYGVQHESPQVLLIKNGACVYDESQNGITMQEIIEQLQ